jgi:aminopeptidase YwaD
MFKRNSITLIVLFVVCFSFGFSDPNTEITSGELKDHVIYLSSEELAGRFPGTTGDKLAQDYIIEKFKSYGVKPGGDNGTYLQNFEMMTSVKQGVNNNFTVGRQSFTSGQEFIPIGFSTDGSIEGNLVFAGYGINDSKSGYNDYKDIDVSGKIAVILRYSPDPHNAEMQEQTPLVVKTIRAKENNAAGIIFVTGPVDDPDDRLVDISFSNSFRDAGIPVINITRETFDKVFASSGYTIQQLQDKINNSGQPSSFELSGVTAGIQTDVEQVTITTGNVIGVLEGNDPSASNEAIVIGAHYDHLGYGEYGSLYSGTDKQIHHGADDNASGVAGVLELAQKFASQKGSIKHDIVFMLFSGEEAGLLGSNFFTKSDKFKEMNVVAMLNMDMIGRIDKNQLVIYGIGSSPVWEPVIKNYNTNYSFDITYTKGGFGRSDHSSFYSNNVPAVHFFTGSHEDYHRPDDTYEKLDYSGQEKIVKLVYDVTSELDSEVTPPEFTKAEEEGDENRTMGSVRIYVGTIPDYAYSGKGMKLSGVKEGGPADKGGLQAGDIIIKFGEKDVETIYDFMFAMGSYKPDDEVDFVVLRDDKEVTLKVVLEKR